MRSSAINVVAARFDIVHGSPPHMRARCPAHGSKGGTLDIRETPDGKVLLRCHAGCTIDDVLHAAGLAAGDLFPDRESQWRRDREWFAARQRFEAAPKQTIHAAIDKALAQLRERLSKDNGGYVRPLRASDYNGVRRLVCRMLEIDPLPELAPFPWEVAPHDSDSAWPGLYMLALHEAMLPRWRAAHPNASAWEWDTDPAAATLDDRIWAEQLARQWLRAL